MSKQLFLERRYPGAQHGSLIQFACQTPRFVFQVINQIPDNSDIHYRWPRRANAAYMGTRHFQRGKAWVSTKTKRKTVTPEKNRCLVSFVWIFRPLSYYQLTFWVLSCILNCCYNYWYPNNREGLPQTNYQLNAEKKNQFNKPVPCLVTLKLLKRFIIVLIVSGSELITIV